MSHTAFVQQESTRRRRSAAHRHRSHKSRSSRGAPARQNPDLWTTPPAPRSILTFVLTREAHTAGTGNPAAPGAPKLGVIPPRSDPSATAIGTGSQPRSGGASVALRKLVEQARRTNQEADRRRQATEATYRFVLRDGRQRTRLRRSHESPLRQMIDRNSTTTPNFGRPISATHAPNPGSRGLWTHP